jgi:hypothetical protein
MRDEQQNKRAMLNIQVHIVKQTCLQFTDWVLEKNNGDKQEANKPTN